MSEKEGKEAPESEAAGKPEEIPENLATGEAPTSLETIVTEPPPVRNGVQSQPKDKAKIDVLLKATANAPIMKQKKWSVAQDQSIGRISDFVRKYLKLDPSERLFIYVNQTFAPPPDQTVKNLYDCFGADGKLILYYCKNQAWG